MDKDVKQMFELILQKFDGIDARFDGMDKRLDGMDKRFDGIDARLDGIDVRLDGIEKRQEEMYLMQKSLEENIKITRAEQDKMMYTVADIQGKVLKLSSQVEDHESVIRQIRAIK